MGDPPWQKGKGNDGATGAAKQTDSGALSRCDPNVSGAIRLDFSGQSQRGIFKWFQSSNMNYGPQCGQNADATFREKFCRTKPTMDYRDISMTRVDAQNKAPFFTYEANEGSFWIFNELACIDRISRGTRGCARRWPPQGEAHNMKVWRSE
jgi:hypothetical protein